MKRGSILLWALFILFATPVLAIAEVDPVCSAESRLLAWHHESLPDEAPDDDGDFRNFIHTFEDALTDLRAVCAATPDDLRATLKQGEAVDWLIDADNRSAAFLQILFLGWEMVSQDGEGSSARPDVHEMGALHEIVAGLNRDLNWLRWHAYDAVRTVEVVREIEVEVEQPEDPCAKSLRQAAGRWADMLGEWTGIYQGSGEDWRFAKQSVSELRMVQRGDAEPIPYMVGWLSQWRTVRRHGTSSLFGSGPVPRIAEDMRAQLSLCGVVVTDGRRHR